MVTCGDCNDADVNVNPGIVEICNQIDDDCNGEIDEGLLEHGFVDADGDGFGDPDSPVEVALDPGRFPFLVGSTCDLFVVAARTADEWTVTPDLIDVRPDGPQPVTVTGANAGALAGGPFTIDSDHDRSFTMPYGAYVSESGAWWQAKQAADDTAAWAALPTFLTVAAYEAQRAAMPHG